MPAEHGGWRSHSSSTRVDVRRRCQASLAPAALYLITAVAACGSQDERHVQPVPSPHDGTQRVQAVLQRNRQRILTKRACGAQYRLVQAVCSTVIS